MPFVKGQSGNPGGRPKLPDDVRDLARAACPEAIERAIEHMRSADENVSLKAITVLLDRGYGKPTQEITATITQSHEAMLDALEAGVSGEIVLPVH